MTTMSEKLEKEFADAGTEPLKPDETVSSRN